MSKVDYRNKVLPKMVKPNCLTLGELQNEPIYKKSGVSL